MAVYIFTGKLGSGKTLCAVGRIKEKIQAGCRIATNLDLDLVQLVGARAKEVEVIRIPDKPKIADLESIGIGSADYDESRNGLLVLDECGTWFNSRNWNDKDRKPVNDWFLHARKLGWDVILIIQDIKLLDSQAREALAEHTAFCRRLDRLTIPLIGSLYKAITGFRMRLPKLHVVKCVYGTSPQDLVSDRWVYRGSDLYQAYDTKQLFLADYPHGVYSILPPWLTRGRYQVKRDWRFAMRITRIYWKRLKAPAALAIGSMVGVMLGFVISPGSTVADQEADLITENEPAEQAGQDPDQVEPETPLDVITFAEKYKGYRIVGYMESDQKYAYRIRLPGGEEHGLEYFRSQGIGVHLVNNCQLIFTNPADRLDRANIFARDCSAITHGKEPFDLDTLPTVEKFAISAVQF